MSRHKFITESL